MEVLPKALVPFIGRRLGSTQTDHRQARISETLQLFV